MDPALPNLDALHWAAPAVEREAAIADLAARAEEVDLAALILPPGGKGTWEGAAEVFRRIGAERLGSRLPDVLVWLQDSNWPGAPIIERLCLDGDRSAVLSALREAMDRADDANDATWLRWLGRLACDIAER